MDQMAKDFIKNESGAIALVMALLMVVFLMIAALVNDYGYMSVVQNELKKAAEAGALAGAAALGLNQDWSAGQTAATNFVTQNYAAGQQLTSCQVIPGYWDVINKTFVTDTTITPSATQVAAIKVTVTKSVQLFFAPIFGINSANLSGTSLAVAKGSPPYTLFAGDPNSDLTLSAWWTKVTGSIFSNRNIKISGWFVNITGTAAAVKSVTKSGIGISIGQTVNNASAIAMPDYSSNITNLSPTVYNGNTTFSGINMSINNSIYVKATTGKGAQPGNLTIDGVGIRTTGAVLADGDINITSAGFTISGANQMALYSKNGNITINAAIFGDIGSSAIVYAPNGTVTVNALGAAFQGSIIAKAINITGAALTFKGGYGVKSIPGAGGSIFGTGGGAALVQ